MKIKRFLTMLVLFVGFSYADSNIQQDLETIAKTSNNPSKLYAIQVSAPGTIISEKMMLMAMCAGTLTRTAQDIKSMLESGNVKQLGIVSESEAVNIATTKQAINALDRKVDATIYIIAKESDCNEIKSLASQKGISLVVLSQTASSVSSTISQPKTEQQNTPTYEDNELTKLRNQTDKEHFKSLKQMIPKAHK
jgi:predicted transcriptional regulator